MFTVCNRCRGVGCVGCDWVDCGLIYFVNKKYRVDGVNGVNGLVSANKSVRYERQSKGRTDLVAVHHCDVGGTQFVWVQAGGVCAGERGEDGGG